jgi:hypothetical protein
MARYERTYTGERMTERMSVYVTPSLRAELEAAAEVTGAVSLNGFLNELLADRLAATVAASRRRRDPEAAAVLRELNANGNLLNQLMRHANSTGELGPERLADVEEALRAIKAAAGRVYSR